VCEGTIKVHISGRSKGGGLGPPLFLDQTDAQRVRPGPPLSQGMDDCSRPPTLSAGLAPLLDLIP